MGKGKYIRQIEELFSKSPVVSSASIARIVKHRKGAKPYAKQLIHYLTGKGEIKRLAKGYYTKHDDASLAVFCFQPAYLGLQDALSFHNLWEQETIPVIVTTRKVRQGVRSFLGANVLIRRISSKYFFGFEYYEQDNAAFPYSGIEKTFLDLIYFREKLDENLVAAFREKMDIKKLKMYVKHYPKRIRTIALSILAQQPKQLNKR